MNYVYNQFRSVREVQVLNFKYIIVD